MNNLSEQESTFVLHIHEHLGPLRDRVSRMEAIVETHSGAISGIRRDIQELDKKVDNNHIEQLKAVTSIKDEVLLAFRQHDTKDEASFSRIYESIHGSSKDLEDHVREFEKIKWMILGGVSLTTTLIGGLVLLLQYWTPFG